MMNPTFYQKTHQFLNRHIQAVGLQKMMLVTSLLSLIVFSIAYALSMHFLSSSSLRQNMVEMWQIQTLQIAEQAKFPIMVQSSEQAETMVAVFKQNPQVLYLSLSTNKQIVYTFGQSYSCSNSKSTAAYDSNSNTSLFETADYWCFQAPVTDNLTDKAIGQVRIIVSKQQVNQLIQRNLLMNGLLISLFALMIYGIIYYLTRLITIPLSDVAKVMTKTKEGQRKLRINTQGPKEIVHIQDAFNQMIASLEKHESNLEKMVLEKTIELSNAYQSAQAASKVKSDILKIVSHEMKTPLHNARMYLELFLENNPDIDNDYLLTAISSIDKLNELINALLDYARGVAENITLSFTSFKLKPLINSVADEIKSSAQKNGNQIILQSSNEISLYSDEKIVRQILVNLVSNANKFTLDGQIIINWAQQDDHVIITISDTGCGIAPDQINQIFQPFYQVDMSSSRSYEGTGLGLAICKLFAEALKGEVTVESKVNVGSSFVLTLPVNSGSSSGLQT
jgi:signal transduction histidine kinase